MPENRITVKIIVDNKADGRLMKEHGFSAWIEAFGRKILFDTGQGKALIQNSALLNCDLSLADTLFLSHGHYDHTGGLVYVLKQNPSVKIYCHSKVVIMRYSIREGMEPKDISMPQKAKSAILSLNTEQVCWITRPGQIGSNIGLSGSIPRTNPFENTGGSFFLDTEGKQPDPIEDDMALWIQTDQGLVIITGCCHSGLINTVEHVRRTSGQEKIHAIIGGFHLANASPRRLEATCEALQKWNIKIIIPCHCTGDTAAAFLRNKLGKKVIQGFTGMTWKTDN